MRYHKTTVYLQLVMSENFCRSILFIKIIIAVTRVFFHDVTIKETIDYYQTCKRDKLRTERNYNISGNRIMLYFQEFSHINFVILPF